MLQELRRAFSGLRRAPAFAVVTWLTLGLGIGATTALFSAVNGRLLKSLPYRHPDRLVELHQTAADGSRRGVALLNLDDWRSAGRSFEAMAGYLGRSFGLRTSLRADEPVAVVPVGMVTPDFFIVLGANPFAGTRVHGIG